jgi:hypothetical protein
MFCLCVLFGCYLFGWLVVCLFVCSFLCFFVDCCVLKWFENGFFSSLRMYLTSKQKPKQKALEDFVSSQIADLLRFVPLTPPRRQLLVKVSENQRKKVFFLLYFHLFCFQLLIVVSFALPLLLWLLWLSGSYLGLFISWVVVLVVFFTSCLFVCFLLIFVLFCLCCRL